MEMFIQQQEMMDSGYGWQSCEESLEIGIGKSKNDKTIVLQHLETRVSVSPAEDRRRCQTQGMPSANLSSSTLSGETSEIDAFGKPSGRLAYAASLWNITIFHGKTH